MWWKFLVGLAVLLAIGYVVVSLTLNFDGETLGRSLATETGAPHYQFGCRRLEPPELWDCALFDGTSHLADYRVRRTEGKCWTARRVRPSDSGPNFPRQSQGCVDALEAIEGALGFGPSLSD